MVNGSSGNIQSYFKRQKTDAVAEDPPPAQPLPLLLELEQQHENQDEEPQTNNSVPLPVVFRGMEFLEQDPALRPQIWQYPPNQRDSVRRSYLLLGPMQPKLKEYKASGKKGHQRRFQYKWFEKFPSWLEYSEDSHRAYCLFCFVSSRNFSSKGGSDVFTVHGFDNWKRSYATKTERGFILCMMKEILGLTEALGQALQKRSQDIVNAIRLVFATKECLRKLRSDDGWEEFFCTVVEFCVNHGIEIPDMKETYIMRGGRARHQPDHFTKKQYFRVVIFRATLDSQLYELDRRFSEKIMDLLSTSAKLIPRNKFKSFKASDICELVKKYYPADFSQQDQYVLEQQLKLFVADASNDVELKNVSTLTDLCQLLVETGRDKIYHLIDRLLRLLVTLPVSTASAERAISSLKIIKTRLRNKMEDENLANNLVVHIEREIAEKYNFEDILMDFKSMGDRKADL